MSDLPTPQPAPKYASPAHQALAEYAAMLNSLPEQVTVTVTPAPPNRQTLAAQLRAVLANQSQYQGGQ